MAPIFDVGWYKCFRILFIIIDFIFLLTGVAMIGLGVYVQVTKGEFFNLIPKAEYASAPSVLIAGGVIVIVFSFIGILGAWMHSQCLLVMYFTSVFIIFCIEIAAGVLGFVYRSEIDDNLQSQLLSGLKDPERRESWNFIQKEFKCCGVNNASDWFSLSKNAVPDSCCQSTGCGQQGTTLAYRVGCYSKAVSFLKDNMYAIGAAGIGFACCQILVMMCTLILIHYIRRYHGKLA
ncbi:tetraspanin-9-like [Gigantopelta aegis]|uniref:tetraspanin-9-like n=1 Tax=Gigantopelta aegis TaxID=1735272 RepID=UPI001B88C8F4|nr:tetraspanin-9-like [Gigantopelta aegis]